MEPTDQTSLLLMLRLLEEWYEVNHRSLPWRSTRDPYYIWLSEVILQQTRVAQGIDYYHRFVEHYPTLHDLAIAPLDQVLKDWEGLGYYSRARNLHRTAQIVDTEFGGQLPDSYAALRALPGIGEYTAGAILSFAFDQPYPALDGNVLRLLSRVYGSELPIDSGAGQRFYRSIAIEWVTQSARPAIHNQACIELGALVCTPQVCDCSLCPLEHHCIVAHDPYRLTLPHRKSKAIVRPRHLGYLFIVDTTTSETRVALWMRPLGDIWAGLYEPLSLFDRDTAPAGVIADRPPFRTLGRYLHRLTHRQLFIDCYFVLTSDDISPSLDYPLGAHWVPLYDDTQWGALPIVLKQVLSTLAHLI